MKTKINHFNVAPFTYLYALRNRPPGYATVPSRWNWSYVTAPPYMMENARFREANPTVYASEPEHRHGVIGSQEKLSTADLLSYEIEWINDPEAFSADDTYDDLSTLLYGADGDMDPRLEKARDLFEALDSYLQNGGRLPSIWKRARPAK